jgi:isoleucyl-tRNA synthetase
VQQARRDAGLQVSDRISVTLLADGEVGDAVRTHEQFLRSETLADDVSYGSLTDHRDDAPTSTVGDGATVGVLVVRS